MNLKERISLIYKKPWIVKTTVLIALVIVYFLVMFISQAHAVKDKDNNLDKFSAQRVQKHIEQIAQKPHYHTTHEQDAEIYQNLLEVRAYIQTTLQDMGIATIVRNYPVGSKYDDYYWEYENYFEENGIIYYYGNAERKYREIELDYEIENYVVEFKGKSDTAILLSAHYDSAPPNYWPFIYNGDGIRKEDAKGVSLGAADDGYGVGTILEICRLLKRKSEAEQLENTVKLLINDGEELGYYGVKLELQKHEDYYKDVSFVVNLEARGTSGNAIMFETVKHNSRIMELYSKGKNKFANSLSSFVANQMFEGGSYTDFGKYVENGFVGIGFANVKLFDDYHSKNDNLQNVSLKTIQQLGNQVYPIVLEFAQNPKYSDVNYFKSGDETIFFTILPNLLITMNFMIQAIIASFILLAAGVLVFLRVKKKQISIIKILIFFVVILLAMIAVSGITLLFTYIYSLILNIKFELINMYGAGNGAYVLCGFVTFLVFATMICLLNLKKLRKYQNEIYIAITALLMLVSIIMLMFLPHGTHVFSILLFYCLWFFIKDYIKSLRRKGIVTVAIMLLIGLFYLPILSEMFYSIAFGGFAIVVALAFLPLLVISLFLNDITGNEFVATKQSKMGLKQNN